MASTLGTTTVTECETCGNTGEVQEDMLVFEGGEWGHFDVEVPCPDCQPLDGFPIDVVSFNENLDLDLDPMELFLMEQHHFTSMNCADAVGDEFPF